MKKLLLFLSVLGLTLTGCEDNNESASNVLTSEIKVDGVSFKPSSNGAGTSTSDGAGEDEDTRYFSLVKGNNDEISQAIYITLQLRDGRSNDGGSYIFHLGENATDLFATGVYLEGDVSYHLSAGTVHVTEMTDGYFKIVFENVEAVDIFGTGEPKLITGEFKGKFKVIPVFE